MKPHMHVTGYSSMTSESEHHFLQVVEQPRPIYVRARLYGLLESITDKLRFHKTNRWFEHMHLARCHNDCRWSGLGRITIYNEDGAHTTEERVMCGYDPPALRLELHTRFLEFTKVKTLGDVEVSPDEYNRIFFNGRKVV